MTAPQDRPWDGLIEATRSGRLTPVISDHLAMTWLMDADALAPAWNEHARYNGRSTDKSEAAQYAAIMNGEVDIAEDYTAFLKQRFVQWLRNNTAIDSHLVDKLAGEAPHITLSQMASMAEYPQSVTGRPDSFRLLAWLSQPLYITTGYHWLMEEALSREGKEPQPAFCYWHDEIYDQTAAIFDEEPDYIPTEQRPLVYHLLGWDREPSSMVLTVDNHLQFLKRLAGDPERLPGIVHQALSENALLLLDYRHRDWEFRTLFRLLRSYAGGGRSYPGLATQQRPEADDEATGQQMVTFLERYFEEADLTLYWGDSNEFLPALLERLQSAS